MDEMTIQRARKQQNLLVWSQRVADCRSSGMSINRWCAEHDIRPKTYYNWQKKVFAAMIEQQETLAKVTETQSHFVELPAPILEPAPVSKSTTQRNDIIASIRIGSASLDIYTGADAEVAVALCKVLSNAE